MATYSKELSENSLSMEGKRLLMHVCCAPCSGSILQHLIEEGFFISASWYNPNIHPLAEWQNRLDSVEKMALDMNIKLYKSEEYQLKNWINTQFEDIKLSEKCQINDIVNAQFEDTQLPKDISIKKHCSYCYEIRMNHTAELAAKEGFDYFTTSLLISPYQNHDAIIDAANRAARKHHVAFLYRDFRPYYREGRNLARAKAWYMQKYCGCIYSYSESDHPKKPEYSFIVP